MLILKKWLFERFSSVADPFISRFKTVQTLENVILRVETLMKRTQWQFTRPVHTNIPLKYHGVYLNKKC